MTPGPNLHKYEYANVQAVYIGKGVKCGRNVMIELVASVLSFKEWGCGIGVE